MSRTREEIEKDANPSGERFGLPWRLLALILEVLLDLRDKK